MSKRRRIFKPAEVQQVYEKHGSFIYRVIQFHLGQSPDSDDIFQSFFLHLLDKPTPSKVIDSRKDAQNVQKHKEDFINRGLHGLHGIFSRVKTVLVRRKDA